MRQEGDALVAGPDALLFIGSPYLTSPQDLERYNLYLSDFPSHEIAPDHMLMTAAKQERAAEALRQAHKSNCALRETLAEALAQQEEETVRPRLNVSSAGRTLLQLLDELLVGGEVDLHKVMEARNTLLRAGSDLWRPLNVDWSKVSVGDSEVNEALTKLLLGHPLMCSFEEECPTGQGSDSGCDGPGTGAGTGTGTPGGNSAHAHSGERLDRPLPSQRSSRLLQPRQGEAPPAAAAASAAQAQVQVQHRPSSPLGRFPSYLESRMNSSMKPLSRNPSISAAGSLHAPDVQNQAAVAGTGATGTGGPEGPVPLQFGGHHGVSHASSPYHARPPSSAPIGGGLRAGGIDAAEVVLKPWNSVEAQSQAQAAGVNGAAGLGARGGAGAAGGGCEGARGGAVSSGGAACAAAEYWQGQRDGQYAQYAPGPMCQACQGSGRDRDGNTQAATCTSWFSVSGSPRVQE